MIVNDWSLHGGRDQTAERMVSSGAHALKLEFYEEAGFAAAKSSWEVVASSQTTNSVGSNQNPTTGNATQATVSTCAANQWFATYYNN